VTSPNLQNVNKPYQTKQEWVYSTLKDAIQSCSLAPGTRLTLDDLAEQLKVSRVPVREALLQLQVEGLVDMTPHAGAVVSPISLDSIYELFMILEELEVLAGIAVAERSRPEDLVRLEDILEDMAAAVVKGDDERWAELNTEFHKEISHLSGMPFLQQITEKALEKWDRMRRCFLTEVLHARTDQAHQEHRQICVALKEGDVEAVEGRLRAHNRHALEAYLAYLSEKAPSLAPNSDRAA
jgi:DNA-binding GntR family transcriptional regulator